MQQTIIDPFGLLSSASDNNFTDAFVDAINLNKVESVVTDPINNWLVVTYIDGTISNLNLDDVVTDIYVDGATLDAITNVLTLTNSQGGADVVVNLSDFINSAEFITGQALKVDKVVGKQLSTEDYSTTEKDKLATIEDGATADQTDLEIEALYEGLADTNKFSDVDKQSILNNTQAIANLATAQCQIHNDDTTVITTSNQVLSFATNIGSTDEDVFSVDDTAETITFYKNASYNFSSTVTFASTTNSTRTVTFDLINTADDSVIATEMAIMSTNNGDTEIANIITLLTIGRNGMPSAPCTIRIEVRADGDGYSIPVFHSILASSSSYDVTTNASGISVVPVGDIESTNVQDALEELDSEKANKVDVYTKVENDAKLALKADKTQIIGKNILINPNNTINQRGFSGDWSSVSVGEYGYDRWRKWDATQKVQPIIEGNYKPNTVYTLSNNGVFVATLTSPASGVWNVITLQTNNNLQLEEGSEITEQEFRFEEDEQRLCYAYFWILPQRLYTFLPNSTNIGRTCNVFFPATMRVIPNITNLNFSVGTATLSTRTRQMLICYATVGDSTTQSDLLSFTADAEVY